MHTAAQPPPHTHTSFVSRRFTSLPGTMAPPEPWGPQRHRAAPACARALAPPTLIGLFPPKAGVSGACLGWMQLSLGFPTAQRAAVAPCTRCAPPPITCAREHAARRCVAGGAPAPAVFICFGLSHGSTAGPGEPLCGSTWWAGRGSWPCGCWPLAAPRATARLAGRQRITPGDAECFPRMPSR